MPFNGDFSNDFFDLWNDISNPDNISKAQVFASKISKTVNSGMSSVTTSPLVIIGTTTTVPPVPYIGSEVLTPKFSYDVSSDVSQIYKNWGNSGSCVLTAQKDADIFAKAIFNYISSIVLTMNLHSGAPLLSVPPYTTLSTLLFPVFSQTYCTPGVTGITKAKASSLSLGIISAISSWLPTCIISGTVMTGPVGPLVGGTILGTLL